MAMRGILPIAILGGTMVMTSPTHTEPGLTP